MKAIKIIFMLTLVVVAGVVGVFFVEDFTTPVIDKNLQDEIELALLDIYPAIEGSGYSVEDSTLDFDGTPIVSAIEVKDGDKVMAVIYTVEFTGFSSQIKYLVGVDAEGNITGYKTLAQGDTAGYGAQIADSENWKQFTGMLIETAGNGDFDGLTGASITTGKWKQSFADLYTFHAANFPIQPLSEEEKMLLQAETLAPTGTTVSLYTPTLPYGPSGIGYVFVANDGSEDVMAIYYINFFGLFGENEIMVSIDLDTNQIVDFKALSSLDTPEYGGLIMEESYWATFTDKSSDDLVATDIDDIAGSTGTTDALKTSLQDLAIWHQAEFQGIVAITPEVQFEMYKEDLFKSATIFTDVTAEKPADVFITNIFDAYDDDSNYQGTIYYVTTIVSAGEEVIYVKYLIGINPAGIFKGFQMVETNDTHNTFNPFFAENFDDTLQGDNITGEYGLDNITGLETEIAVINAGIADIVDYHQNKYSGRGDHVVVDNADLLLAFPGAASFEEVYGDYAYDGNIGNIYAAKDGSDTILGYAYYSEASGVGTIKYVIGIGVDGKTEEIHIMDGFQTWDLAPGHSGGSSFVNSTWLASWEDVEVQTLIDSPISAIGGVSLTTNGMRDSLAIVFNYHVDNNVGGAN